ncbi:MAG: hypothetical protein ACE5R6_00375 [Candidatus Heimdallarchaeota archaeon]
MADIATYISTLAEFSPIVLIIIGIISGAWFISNVLHVFPGFIDNIADALSTIAKHAGWIFGALGLITAAAIFKTNEYLNQGWFTVTLLIIVGFALFMEPFKDIPWAALVGLVAGGGIAALICFRYGDRVTGTILGIEMKYILGAIMVIIFLLVFLALKFIEDVTKATTMILRFQPVATFLGLLCIIQGVLIILGNPLTFETLSEYISQA